MKDAYDYKILKHTDPDVLSKEVVKSFREGWEPIGGVAITTAKVNNEVISDRGETQLLYAQALVKR